MTTINTVSNEIAIVADFFTTGTEIDALTAKHTAFANFADFLATAPNYRPTMTSRPGRAKATVRRNREIEILANAFDTAAETLGQKRTAWRGNN